MRLLCMFDLPMETSSDKRQYRIFRKELIKNGFTMLQYSIYYRTLPNRSAGKRYQHALQSFLPQGGEVRLLAVSEKQFADMQVLVGHRSYQEVLVGSKTLVTI
ncbi:CRISPR-associated endonuclease Cas2 [Lactobacillus sp. DCY120]|uniref:CRISPR-associated endoribonuclease Cas2 n=2 Tax=Bombilactobacillus apium TaxID=2675299 RepID=A0A850R7P1_9LACO|nr:CRISPR-associated endonuclease Cas2 [Bombilactobacillus apium]